MIQLLVKKMLVCKGSRLIEKTRFHARNMTNITWIFDDYLIEFRIYAEWQADRCAADAGASWWCTVVDCSSFRVEGDYISPKQFHISKIN